MSDNPDSTRLNKHLALQLGVSRRQADELIEAGKVTLNGAGAALGARFTPGDEVKVSGRPVGEAAELRYVAFHKPVGYVCSRRKQGESETIYAMLPPEFAALRPVGRLDKNSSGLLLLSNDGDFAYRMTHPKFAKTKIYEVGLGSELEPLHQQMISDLGIQLDDGRSRLGLQRLNETDRRSWQVTMSEGRNRQIRRTFAALGYNVTRLHRTHFGNYSLGDIKEGAWAPVDIR